MRSHITQVGVDLQQVSAFREQLYKHRHLHTALVTGGRTDAILHLPFTTVGDEKLGRYNCSWVTLQQCLRRSLLLWLSKDREVRISLKNLLDDREIPLDRNSRPA